MRCLPVIAVLACLPLLGGATCARVAKPPREVTVVIEKIVPVPPALTAPCPIEAKRRHTYGEALRLAGARKLQQEFCNCKLLLIRALGQPLSAPEQQALAVCRRTSER